MNDTTDQERLAVVRLINQHVHVGYLLAGEVSVMNPFVIVCTSVFQTEGIGELFILNRKHERDRLAGNMHSFLTGSGVNLPCSSISVMTVKLTRSI